PRPANQREVTHRHGLIGRRLARLNPVTAPELQPESDGFARGVTVMVHRPRQIGDSLDRILVMTYRVAVCRADVRRIERAVPTFALLPGNLVDHHGPARVCLSGQFIKTADLLRAPPVPLAPPE